MTNGDQPLTIGLTSYPAAPFPRSPVPSRALQGQAPPGDCPPSAWGLSPVPDGDRHAALRQAQDPEPRRGAAASQSPREPVPVD